MATFEKQHEGYTEKLHRLTIDVENRNRISF